MSDYSIATATSTAEPNGATPNHKHAFERQSAKPTPLAVVSESIPEELKILPQWVCWRFTWKKSSGKTPGKWTKPLFDARTGKHASSTDPTTWATFDLAMGAYLTETYDGIGFVFAPDDPYIGLDLDNVVDPATGEVAPWAKTELAALGSYCEISPSGTGVKLIGRGHAPTGGRKFDPPGVEIYDSGRYFTITGHRLPHASAGIADVQAAVDDLHARFEADKSARADVKRQAKKPQGHRNGTTTGALTDDQIRVKATAARNGAKFVSLWNGDVSGYESQSNADLAFCNMLCFWTPDDEQVARLWKSSGLSREKLERDDYAQRTIATARASNSASYDPSRHHRRADPEGATPEGAPANDSGGDDSRESVALTDLGNGKRFAADHGAIARFCHPWGKWLFWDGARWRLDDTGRAMALAKKTILGLFRWAADQLKRLAEVEDDSPEAKAAIAKIKRVLDHALKSQDHRRLKAMIDLAKSEQGIPVLPDALDVDPWALNVANGTLDLRSGELRPHKQSDYLTKISPVTFDPSATCPKFDNFLAEIFDYSESLVAYMWRLIGYWLTGQVTEHALPVLYGTGANGKSTLMGVNFDLLGPDYSGKAARDLLVAVKGDRHPTALAWLHGRRFVAAIETAEGARLDEVLIKELTGGDSVTARRMREDFWTFKPTHKICLVTNHKPTIKGTDHAIWRRLRLIPFTVCFAEDRQDKHLAEKLRGERSGILNRALAGCQIWQKHGLADPAEVLAATAEYRSAEDRLGEFLAERCRINSEFRVKTADLYAAFRHWAETNGEREMSATAFGTAVGERGFRRDAGRRWYLGIDLAPYEGLGGAPVAPVRSDSGLTPHAHAWRSEPENRAHWRTGALVARTRAVW